MPDRQEDFSISPAIHEQYPPEFRAWYSGNPSLLDNALQPAPPASETIFVTDPSITEALEAIYSNGPQIESEPVDTDLRPVEPQLALEGLRKLKSNRLGPRNRLQIIDTLKHVRAMVQTHVSIDTAPPSLVTPSPEAHTTRPPIESPHEEMMRIVEASEGVLEEQEVEHTHVEQFLDMSRYFVADERGGVKTRGKGVYQKKLQNQGKMILEDPLYCFNFFRTGAILAGQAVDDESSVLSHETIIHMLTDTYKVAGTTVVGLDTIRTSQKDWFQLMGTLPPDRVFSPAAEIKEAEKNGEFSAQIKIKTTEDMNRFDRLQVAGHTQLWGEAVVSSIVFHAKKNPYEAFDTLYDLASEGFDPEHAHTLYTALEVTVKALEKSDELQAMMAFDSNPRALKSLPAVIDLANALVVCGHQTFWQARAEKNRQRLLHSSTAARKMAGKTRDLTGTEQESIEREVEELKQGGDSIHKRMLAYRASKMGSTAEAA